MRLDEYNSKSISHWVAEVLLVARSSSTHFIELILIALLNGSKYVYWLPKNVALWIESGSLIRRSNLLKISEKERVLTKKYS